MEGQKGDVVRCLVVRTKSHSTKAGLSYSSSNNAVVLLDANNNPIGNRLVGPVTDNLKKSGFSKIINMASLSTF